MTFKEWAKKWLLLYKKGSVKASTYTETYKRTVEKYLIPYFGTYELSNIKPVDLLEFFSIQADKYYLSTIQKMKLCLNSIFETAIENDFCFKNPAKSIKIFSNLQSGAKETYSKEETETILKLSDTHKYGIYIRLLLELGLRCSELCGLMWSDFDFDKRTVSIQRACTEVEGRAFIDKPKNKSSKRTLPLSSELCERLLQRGLEGKNDYIIIAEKSKTGLPFTPCNFSNGRYKTFFTDMKIQKILPPHNLRHTCGTLLYERTHDIYAVSKYLGHSGIDITARLYIHENVEMLRNALNIC